MIFIFKKKGNKPKIPDYHQLKKTNISESDNHTRNHEFLSMFSKTQDYFLQ